VDVTIHWKGGCVTEHEFTRPTATYAGLPDLDRLTARVVELRRAGWRAPRIADQLNAEGFMPPKQSQPFTDEVVRHLFSKVTTIREVLEEYELKSNEWPVADLAKCLGMPVKKLKDWVTRGWRGPSNARSVESGSYGLTTTKSHASSVWLKSVGLE
jgi:hypothetical protein